MYLLCLLAGSPIYQWAKPMQNETTANKHMAIL